jgi:hypothetical protein
MASMGFGARRGGMVLVRLVCLVAVCFSVVGSAGAKTLRAPRRFPGRPTTVVVHSRPSRKPAPARTVSPPAASVPATAPTSVRHASVKNVAANLGTGATTIEISWQAPRGGPAADHYDLQACAIAASQLRQCSRSSASWMPAGTVIGGGPTVSTTRSCQQASSEVQGISTCYYRIRGVDAAGHAGIWHSVNAQPWAPYELTLLASATPGVVVVLFHGPSESGPRGNAKDYMAWVCRGSCSDPHSWTDTGLRASYPPAGAAGHILGTFDCGLSATCEFRAQFNDGSQFSIPTPPVATTNVTTSGSTTTTTTPTTTTPTTTTPTTTNPTTTPTTLRSTNPTTGRGKGTTGPGGGSSSTTSPSAVLAGATSHAGTLALTGTEIVVSLFVGLVCAEAGLVLFIATRSPRRQRHYRRT